jgi:nucleoside-diphosphate-sugar epimerase
MQEKKWPVLILMIGDQNACGRSIHAARVTAGGRHGRVDVRGRGGGGDDDRDRGASNAKAKRELGWQPSHPRLGQGFAT